MLGGTPFSIYSSGLIIQDMLDSGDHCSGIILTKVQYFQREGDPSHEFLVVYYCVESQPNVANYFVLERWDSADVPEDPAKTKIDVLDIDTDRTGYDERSGRPTRPFRPPLQDDVNRIIVSYPRNDVDISKMEPGSRMLLATLTPRNHTISVAQLQCVAEFVSRHSPNYDLFDKSCFYYARTIFNITHMLMVSPVVDAVDGFEYFKSDALKQSNDRRQILDRPLREAEAKAEQAGAEARVARLLREQAEAKAEQAEARALAVEARVADLGLRGRRMPIEREPTRLYPLEPSAESAAHRIRSGGSIPDIAVAHTAYCGNAALLLPWWLNRGTMQTLA
ncbi:hypothetical protein B0H16DRAFT_1465315 [Mycena metata]|uniref:Uncharacterized protein n=1 Tax=Mycena metata TaxID=1033252 RepID=A0AAD7IDH6_9AGAR|nr:hypothetical protein B0H16DRAFT_1465315 [Mycena metata]